VPSSRIAKSSYVAKFFEQEVHTNRQSPVYALAAGEVREPGEQAGEEQ